jgi:hypothetical protein
MARKKKKKKEKHVNKNETNKQQTTCLAVVTDMDLGMEL